MVDATTVVSGPYGTLLLADLGAEVVKIESPQGDSARDLGPRAHAGMAAVFLTCNRGKRSVVLDLTTDDGRRALKELCDGADVFVHNMRSDAAAALRRRRRHAARRASRVGPLRDPRFRW